MWKEKVYTGSGVTGTTTVSIRKYPDTSTITVNVAKTDTLNTCIKNFLLECGVPDVVYYPCTGSDARKGNIFINGVPYQFYVTSSYTYWNATSGSFSIYTSSSSVIFNSAGEYSIRLCLAGNPLSSFGFAIAGSSSYGASSYVTNYIMLYKLKSEVDDSIWWLSHINGTNSMWLTKNDGTRPHNSALTTGLVDNFNYSLPTTVMNIFANKYPLIPRYCGVFRMVDCYIFISSSALNVGYSSPTDSKFAKIGNKTYFANYPSSSGLLIDCG